MKITEFTLMRVRVRGRPLGRPVVTRAQSRTSRKVQYRSTTKALRSCVDPRE